jgi:retron-type reverse transcriptase
VDLARWLEVPEQDLRLWLRGRPAGAEYDYHAFTIPKRRGGTRQIHAPGDLLKDLQRRIYRRLLAKLRVHPAATGFVRGRSIVDNARPHAGQGVVINLDLQDFFPSIKAERVEKAFRALGWNRECSAILTNVCTHEGSLPQGAPTSPALSNLVCRLLDTRLSALVQRAGRVSPRTGKAVPDEQMGKAHYTRYADDLTFSFPGFGNNRRRKDKPKGVKVRQRPRWPSRLLLRTIRRILEDEGFQIQTKKRVRIQRTHQRQTVTGLVVNRAVNLPRSTRRKLRAMQHREQLGQLGRAEQAKLQGWRALAAMIAAQRGAPKSGAAT